VGYAYVRGAIPTELLMAVPRGYVSMRTYIGLAVFGSQAIKEATKFAVVGVYASYRFGKRRAIRGRTRQAN